jgi:hypothetical protein
MSPIVSHLPGALLAIDIPASITVLKLAKLEL